MLKVHTLPAFTDNYIWLIQSQHSNNLIIVDPGDAQPVFDFIATTGLSPVVILITHHHSDHIGGATALADYFKIPVYGPADEGISILTNPLKKAGKITINPHFPAVDVLLTPGHTRGHISYLIENKLFCGDTLFAGGCGRLLGGSATQLFSSLQQLKTLNPTTEIYCAHEYTEANLRFAYAVDPDNSALQKRIDMVRALRADGISSVPSLLEDELATNPFLRTNEHAIKKAAEQYSGRPLDDEQAVFTALRAWKDSY